MTAMPMLTQYVHRPGPRPTTCVVVSPDAGRVKLGQATSPARSAPSWAIMEKERPAQQVAEIGYVVGDVKGKTAVLVDDMIDTAGTLCAAAQTVLDEGAARGHRLRHPRRLLRPRLRAPRRRRRSSRSSSPTRSRCAPARPDNITVLSAAEHPRRLDPPHLHRRLGLARSSPARTSSSRRAPWPPGPRKLRLVGHKGADAIVARQHGRELRSGGRGRGRHDRVRRALAAGRAPAAGAAGAAGRRPRLGTTPSGARR